jgi:hypothetical protein
MNQEDDKIDPEIKKLVIWRIETGLPENLRLSIGGKGTFNKEELKEHVEEEDEIGRHIVDMQMQFIKALSSGKFSKVLGSA